MAKSLLNYRPVSTLFVVAVISLSGCRPPESYHPRPNLKLYEKVRDFIRSDTLTQRIFEHPDPFQVWVIDETAHLGIETWDYSGVLEWIASQRGDSVKPRDLYDSLRQHARRASRHEEIIPELRELSTTDDITYSVVFMNIDSVLIPGSYVLAACLAHNTCRGITSASLFSERMTWYVLIMGKDAEVFMATSGGPYIPEYWDPCD